MADTFASWVGSLVAALMWVAIVVLLPWVLWGRIEYVVAAVVIVRTLSDYLRIRKRS